jgi:hypothetical protein
MIRDGFDFEMSIAFDLDQHHKAFCTKDRTGLFQDKEPFIITPDTGRKLLQWCNNVDSVSVDELSKRIGDVSSIKELLDLFQQFPQYREVLRPEFETRKRQIMINQNVQQQLAHQKINTNGTH